MLDSGYNILSEIKTPWDNLIPSVKEQQAQFYLDIIRIYLGLHSGVLSMDQALHAVEVLKENPQFVISPIDPTLFPMNEAIKSKVVENLNTLKKYNLYTTDSVRSAFSFAFLAQDAPLNQNDFAVLKAFIHKPDSSLVDVSENLGIASRTVARSLERMSDRRQIRFTCLIDYSAFDIKTFILFFRVKDEIDWIDLESGLSQFQFVRSVLKTSMTDLGYMVFLIPIGANNETTFKRSIRELSNIAFDYSMLHEREIAGSHINLNLFDGSMWSIPVNIQTLFDNNHTSNEITSIQYLENGGPKKSLGIDDLVVASHLATDYRLTPSKLSQILEIRGWNLAPKQVSTAIRRLRRNNVVIPYVSLGGLNLSTTFTFEIICNNRWKRRLMENVPILPTSITYTSDNGMIIWSNVPSYHQVDYYQVFRSLEARSGVSHVQPIMTLQRKGTRQITDLLKHWPRTSEGWSINPEDLDIVQFIGY